LSVLRPPTRGQGWGLILEENSVQYDKNPVSSGVSIHAHETLPDFDPHSPLARGRGIYRVIAHLARAREEYAREGAWSCLEDEPTPPTGGGGPSGPRPRSGQGLVPTAITRTNGGYWSLKLNRFFVSLTLRMPHRSRVEAHLGPRVRRDMRRSIVRLYEATRYLEVIGVMPTHLITLTLPPEAWEELPDDEARLALWKRALDLFQNAFRMRLRRKGYSGAYLWFLEFQERGAPHLHILVDFQEYLPPDEWSDWADWLTHTWSSALGVPAPYATKIEALQNPDFRYARAYALKPRQKSFPFPAPWGRTWGVGGPWRELLRQSRSEPNSYYRLSVEQAWLLLNGWVQSVLASVPDALLHPDIQSWLASVFKPMASMSSEPLPLEGFGYGGPQSSSVNLSQVPPIPRLKWWWGKNPENPIFHAFLRILGWAASSPSARLPEPGEDGVCIGEGPPILPLYLPVPGLWGLVYRSIGSFTP